MPDGTFIFTQLALTGAVSLFSAWVASQLTLRSALHQKVWERKEAAYTKIIEALYEVKRYYDVRSTWSLLKNMKPDDETISKGRAEGWMVVERAIATGGWHFSSDAAMKLRELMWNMGRADRAGGKDEPVDALDCTLLIGSAIGEIASLAEKDLGTAHKGPWHSRLLSRLEGLAESRDEAGKPKN
jgi:hypothetical protein